MSNVTTPLPPISVKGAKVHNLKNVSVDIPRNKITVITGISGSGKSSLAFDTIFAEGQRRYIESLSTFARQFFGILEKPSVDEITGLSPSLSIDQKTAHRSPRSTVGTMSEVYDYLRLLYATVGTVYCPTCQTKMVQKELKTQHGKREFEWHCPSCQAILPEITISSFSFNSPTGACPTCEGLGRRLEIDPMLVIPNPRLTIAEGAIRPWARLSSGSTWQQKQLENLARRYRFSLNQPFERLPEPVKKLILFGTRDKSTTEDDFEGVIANLQRRHSETESDYVRKEIERYMIEKICPTCQGARLKQDLLNILIDQKNIIDLSHLTIAKLHALISHLQSAKTPLTKTQQVIAKQILDELAKRIHYLIDVGLSYLTLDRNAETLAGGEAQRIRLANQLGSSLMGVIYILDEPSIGLHPKDQQQLLKTLVTLRDLGNTVIIVEHDRPTIELADYIIDVGPGAGEAGGEIVATGQVKDIIAQKRSITGQYLSGQMTITIPKTRRTTKKFLTIHKAQEFNLKSITTRFPLETFICVTGVSGSGKSTLVTDILALALAKHFHRAKATPGQHERIDGLEHLDKVIIVDQSPIGRTPRSNPATYTGVFAPLRELYARHPVAVKKRYLPAMFSFNLKGGRCETCRGEGNLKVEMHFLPNIFVKCETCHGKRYQPEILSVKYDDRSIADVLDMTVDEAMAFFSDLPEIMAKLRVLQRVGLGYIRLGQPAPTLSGGEAQRVKLATELARPSSGRTLYILDEPTTGLHFDDVKRLLNVLHDLVNRGNTVLVVEHNLDVIKNADWVIDLGPEGGDKGGYIVAEGTPEQTAQIKTSYTGQYLKEILKSN